MRSGFGVNESESDACVRCACNVYVCSNNDLLYCTQNTPFGAYCGAYCVLNIGADPTLFHFTIFPVSSWNVERDLIKTDPIISLT